MRVAHDPGMQKSISSLLFVLLVGGCAASGSARYSASVTTPRLVYVSAGVQVIEDYDEPIFYSSNMYWRYDGGVWYQSRYHTTGWVRVATPPAPILRIERPTMYVHYHGRAQATVEDKREIKEDRREIQQEKREEKREDKQDKREDKQDKQDAREAHKAAQPSSDRKPNKK